MAQPRTSSITDLQERLGIRGCSEARNNGLFTIEAAYKVEGYAWPTM